MTDRLAMLEHMIARGSEDPFHHYARAMEFRSRGQLVDALTAFAAVRSKFPDYVPTYLMGAQVAQELERLDDARGWADEGIERAKRSGDDHAMRELSQLRDLLE